MTDIRVPTLGESVTEATIGKWFKQPGDAVAVDEPLVELETDKVTIEVPAPAAGVLAEIAAKDGETVAVGALLGQINQGAGARAVPTKSAESAKTAPPPKAAAASLAQPPKVAAAEAPLAPSVRRLGVESGVAPASVLGTGRDGRVTKGDMLAPQRRLRSPSRPPPFKCAHPRLPMTRRAKSACA